MRYTITIQQSHYNELRTHLLSDEKERVAFIICGRSLVSGEDRLLTRRVVLLNESELIDSSEYSVSWNNNYFIKVLKEAEKKDFAIVVIHNHPSKFDHFSKTDDEGEYNLFKLAFNRNGGDRVHASLIMLPDGSLLGRVWKPDLTHQPINFIRVVGNTLSFWYPERLKNYQSPEIFDRQKIAFGNSLIQDLSKLRIAVIGAGATGSATTVLLSRLGVGELFLIDKDIIEESNLNRLYGAKFSDIGKSKVDVLKKYIDDLGLGTRVTVANQWVNSENSFKLLKNCDLIFGCTDDNAGRIFLNRFAYFYLTPVIDMGLIISIKKDLPEIQDLQGRISYLFPGSDCLVTKGIINIDVAYAENLKRSDPEDYEKLKEEAYVIGEGNPAPAVITFTTQIASMAVNDFLNRLQTFNQQNLSSHKLFFFHRGIEIHPENISNNECRICGQIDYWGRGDMSPLLDMVI